MDTRYRLTFLTLVVMLVGEGFAQESFYLKDRDRVVFYGDSITDPVFKRIRSSHRH